MALEKLTVTNLCGGELATQVSNALQTVAKNIEKHGDLADHELNIKLRFNKNSDFDFWEHDCRTTVGCNQKESQIGSKAPIKIKRGDIFDNNPQQELPIK